MHCTGMLISNETFVCAMCVITICFGGCYFFTIFHLNITNKVNVTSTCQNVNPIYLEDIPLFQDTEVDNLFEDIIKPLEDNIDKEVPQVGMTFKSVHELKQFYRKYAIKCWFGVRIRSSSKGEDNELCFIKLVCSHEGKCHFTIPP